MGSRNLDDLHPELSCKARALIAACACLDIHLFITETLRSNEEQEELYAQGRTKPGKIVTYAKPGESKHNHGLAFDTAFRVSPGSTKITWEGPWELVGQMGEQIGLEWGGRWKKRDRPHFQLSNPNNNEND